MGLAAVFIIGKKKYTNLFEKTIVFNSLQEQEDESVLGSYDKHGGNHEFSFDELSHFILTLNGTDDGPNLNALKKVPDSLPVLLTIEIWGSR